MVYLIAHEHSLTEELLAWGLGLRFSWESLMSMGEALVFWAWNT